MSRRLSSTRLALAFALAVALAAPSRVLAGSSVTWDGSCGNADWSSTCFVRGLPESNWTGGGLPSLGTNSVIPQRAPVVNVTGVAESLSIVCDSGLQLIGGALIRHGAGTSFIVNLHMQGSSGGGIEFEAPGEINLQSEATWLSGRVDGQGEVVNLGEVNPQPNVQAMSINLENGAAWRNDPGSSANMRFLSIGAGCEYENRAGSSLTLRAGPAIAGLVNGAGFFINAGSCTVKHEAAVAYPIDAFLVQAAGSFVVEGVSGGVGTFLTKSASLTGGTIAINDDCTLRFESGSVPVPYVANGLESIGGDGNLRIQLSVAHDFQVLAPLSVNLSGTEGFVLSSGHVSLGAPLTNTGSMLWIGGDIRHTDCGECDPRFVHAGGSAVINASGSVSLDTTFENQATVVQQLGALSLSDDAEFLNGGEYLLVRGNMQRPLGQVGQHFVNAGIFRKPDEPATIDSQISVPFRHMASGQLVVEKGTLEFSSGSELTMEGGAITVQSPGVLSFGSADQVCAQGTDTTISGDGRMVVAASGIDHGLRVDDGATLTLAMGGGDPNGFHVANGGRIGGDGLIVNTGNFYWDVSGILGVEIEPGSATGTIVNAGQAFVKGGSVVGSTTYVNDAGATTTHSAGTISLSSAEASIVNHGIWRETPGLSGTTISGSGGLVNAADAEFIHEGSDLLITQCTIGCPLQNEGTVRVRPHGSLQINGTILGLAEGELTEGSWIVEPEGFLGFPNGTLIFAIGEQVSITGHDGGFNPNFKPTINRGSLRTNGNWTCPQSFENRGQLAIDDGAFTCPGTLSNDGGVCDLGPTTECQIDGDLENIGDGSVFRCRDSSCTVDGDILNGDGRDGLLSYFDNAPVISDSEGGSPRNAISCANFLNAARVRPGGPDQAGSFPLHGNLVQLPTGAIEIDLGGEVPTLEHDQVHVDGDVTLGGDVIVRFLPGYTPKGGEEFTILTVQNGALSGTFEGVVAIDGGTYSLSYSSDAVILTVVAPPVTGDLDGDGTVNATDLAILLGTWGICEECAADLDGDGSVGAADLAILLGAWSSPGGTTASAADVDSTDLAILLGESGPC